MSCICFRKRSPNEPPASSGGSVACYVFSLTGQIANLSYQPLEVRTLISEPEAWRWFSEIRKGNVGETICIASTIGSGTSRV
jgi:hypothetical protein